MEYDQSKKLEQILSKRDDIEFVKDKFDKNWNHDKDKNIQEIPYYNQEPGRTHHLPFLWKPSRILYKKVWKKCIENKKEHPSTTFKYTIIDMNILGIKTAIKKRYTDDY